MSLLKRKREQEKLRKNGLNDYEASQPTKILSVSSNEWGNQMLNTDTTIPHQTPMTSFPPTKDIELDKYIKNMEEDCEKKVKIKGENIPSWKMQSTSEIVNPCEPVIIDKNLQQSKCYEAPLYIDPVTGNPISLNTENSLSNTPTYTSQIMTNKVDQGSHCDNQNCPNCKLK
ncbi:CLUMA_CG011918, isoform A [Clunio marinus]|uniref:CLUMA_CG011918, isoform A n=1 Tax=Clunio marinus TaxID=568069 RepID=A0A1J1IGN6_9DIPT|nr:CLUMA_CG011918, isoform A [Clunio marinus]